MTTNPFAEAAAELAEIEGIKEPETLPVVEGRKVHIDGDYLCYYAGAVDVDAGVARTIAANFVSRAKACTGSAGAVLHLTSAGSNKGERYLAATVKPYQGQRATDDKPRNWEYLRLWAEQYNGPDFMSKVWSSREADDGIAACAAYAVKQGRLDAICTGDKDMRMLPGLHLNWRDPSILTTVEDDTFALSGQDGKLYGRKWFWLQMLHGDSADNIPGLEYAFESVAKGKPERMIKVGPKTAEKLLYGYNDADAVANRVLELYVRGYNGTGDGYDRFCEQACLLWLRRGNQASVTDFADFLPESLSDNAPLARAVLRLDKRVKEARAKLDALSA